MSSPLVQLPSVTASLDDPTPRRVFQSSSQFKYFNQSFTSITRLDRFIHSGREIISELMSKEAFAAKGDAHDGVEYITAESTSTPQKVRRSLWLRPFMVLSNDHVIRTLDRLRRSLGKHRHVTQWRNQIPQTWERWKYWNQIQPPCARWLAHHLVRQPKQWRRFPTSSLPAHPSIRLLPSAIQKPRTIFLNYRSTIPQHTLLVQRFFHTNNIPTLWPNRYLPIAQWTPCLESRYHLTLDHKSNPPSTQRLHLWHHAHLEICRRRRSLTRGLKTFVMG